MLRIRLRRLEAQAHFQLIGESQLLLVVVIGFGIEHRQERIVILTSLIPVVAHIILHELQREIAFESPKVRTLHLNIECCVVHPRTRSGSHGCRFRRRQFNLRGSGLGTRLVRFRRSGNRQHARHQIRTLRVDVQQRTRNSTRHAILFRRKTSQRIAQLRIVERVSGKKREVIRIFEHIVAIIFSSASSLR